MKAILFSCLITVTAFCALIAAAQALEKSESDDKTSLVVVELFTSQSCSSCPPADSYLEKLSGEDNVIAMACHVSYFNRMNWQDTLSNEFCDIRQHGYASLEKPPRVYTPQMIMNGLNPFVGSRLEDGKTAFTRARGQRVEPIEIELDEKTIRFMLPPVDFPINGDFRLWMFGFKTSHTQDISDGENAGKKIHYVNSAITYTNLGAWEGDAISRSAPRPDGDIDGVIIFGQAGGYGRIVAAGKLDF